MFKSDQFDRDITKTIIVKDFENKLFFIFLKKLETTNSGNFWEIIKYFLIDIWFPCTAYPVLHRIIFVGEKNDLEKR